MNHKQTITTYLTRNNQEITLENVLDNLHLLEKDYLLEDQVYDELKKILPLSENLYINEDYEFDWDNGLYTICVYDENNSLDIAKEIDVFDLKLKYSFTEKDTTEKESEVNVFEIQVKYK